MLTFAATTKFWLGFEKGYYLLFAHEQTRTEGTLDLPKVTTADNSITVKKQ